MLLEIAGENTERYQTPGPIAVNVSFQGKLNKCHLSITDWECPQEGLGCKCQSGPQFYVSFSEC